MASLNGEDQEVKREEMTKVAKEVTVNEEKDFEIEDDKSKEEMATKVGEINMNENVVEENTKIIDEKNMNAKKNDEIEEEVKMEVEIKTGVSFPVKLNDGKQLNTMGIRKKKILALGVNIYAFGIYADNEKLKEDLKAKFGKAPEKANKELYDAVINSDVGMTVRLVIVYGSLTMSMVRKNFDEGLGASLKKLNGGQKNEDLVNKVMGAAKDSIKLPSGSIIEISKMPNHVLHMYLGDDPFDKEAKERFGASLLSLF